MQINGISTSPSIPVDRSTTPQKQTESSDQDQAVISPSADLFSSLVSQANQMPEVRSDLVASFKSRIAAGDYPEQSVISGLTDVLGGSILQAAQADSAS
jgi:anti-sigma28 factor (negative regulator of flagellin synthesis)